MESVEHLIIGAGPAGLGAAWRFQQLGRSDWLLCEAENEAGGLAGSVRDEHGFIWDLGGHVQFSHYDYFDDLMDDLLGRDGWLYHERESWVWMRDRFIPYPFQLNLHRLPPQEMWECVRGLVRALKAGSAATPANFQEWIQAVFGEGIAKVFLLPYNFKVWAWPPAEMSWHWIGDRVAVVDLERVLHNIFHNQDDVSWGPNNQFRFPKFGGTGAVWKTLAQRLPAIRYNERLVSLNTSAREAVFASGLRVRYSKLISTVPLDSLVRMSDLAGPLSPALEDLRFSSTHIVGVGIKGQPPSALAKKCWMYFPEANCPFYRVTLFSNYSPNNVPDAAAFWSLMAEVSESPVKPVSGERVVEEVLQGMIDTQLIPEASLIHHTWSRRLAHGYPTPSLHRDRALNAVLPALEARSVFSRGRFGAWKYEVSNQDHSFAQGVEIADRLAAGLEEITLPSPEKVNARKPRPLVAKS